MINKHVLYIPIYIISGIIITGGFTSGGNITRSVEILRSDGSYWCSLPELPDDRYRHTQSGLIACGSGNPGNTSTSCLTFADGEWRISHQLQYRRYEHSAWTSQLGVVLMGGDSGGSTKTELLSDIGQSTPYFNLTESTV